MEVVRPYLAGGLAACTNSRSAWPLADKITTIADFPVTKQAGQQGVKAVRNPCNNRPRL